MGSNRPSLTIVNDGSPDGYLFNVVADVGRDRAWVGVGLQSEDVPLPMVGAHALIAVCPGKFPVGVNVTSELAETEPFAQYIMNAKSFSGFEQITEGDVNSMQIETIGSNQCVMSFRASQIGNVTVDEAVTVITASGPFSATDPAVPSNHFRGFRGAYDTAELLAGTGAPTGVPTSEPTEAPTAGPTSNNGTIGGSVLPTAAPTMEPTAEPSDNNTLPLNTSEPTMAATPAPTAVPSTDNSTTPAPSMDNSTTPAPSMDTNATLAPSADNTTPAPSADNTTPAPSMDTNATLAPSVDPNATPMPTRDPTSEPTLYPTVEPTVEPTTPSADRGTVPPTTAAASVPRAGAYAQLFVAGLATLAAVAFA